MTDAVTITDVFLRDGLQSIVWSEAHPPLSTYEKIEIIGELDAAGLPEIEITGFVHPRVVPNLADAEEVAAGARDLGTKATLRALVPNRRGAERALSSGINKLSCLIVASETYQRLNSNMSVADNLREIELAASLAQEQGASIMVGMGMSFVCPYEGLISEDRILDLVARFVELDIGEVVLADSLGLAWPTLVRDRCAAILHRWPHLSLGLHLHTLAGLGLAGAMAGYEVGVRHFDGSVGGVGGGIRMPIPATRMSNVATEDLRYLFESSGIGTGIDATRISTLALAVQERTGVGSGHVSGFGSLEAFLAMSRERLERADRG